MKAVIMAGGKGTRIASVADNIPKPMMKIANKPILEHQIECLKKNNIRDIILVVGHLKDSIMSYFKDGSKFGVNIEYFVEESPLGTAGALYYIKDKLGDDFFLINGDIIFDIDFMRFYKFHKEKNAAVSVFVHPNSHPYDSALIVTNKDDLIIDWLSKEDNRKYYKNKVNAGIHILSKTVIENIDCYGKVDLDRNILKKLISKSGNMGMYAYSSPEYVKDMGTPERYAETEEDYISGKVADKNLSVKQKAIFLDRDGTLNKYDGYIISPEQLELIDGVGEAVAEMNKLGYLVIVVTNQPVIARGDCTLEELDNIHNKLETLLGEYGAYLDAIYYCPHHPDKGFVGERPEYKIKCSCRKPNIGMILNAAEKFNIDLHKSYMAGDSENDIRCALNAGCIPVCIGNNVHMPNTKHYANITNFVDELKERGK